MKDLKLIVGVIALVWIAFLVSCAAEPLVDPFDAEAQLEEDIATMEEYLADKGYTEYDTLDSEVRVVILDEGDGATIEYADIIHYNYIGKFTNDIIFDTSIRELALTQDIAHTIDTTFETDDNGDFVLDDDNEKIIERINYEEDYIPIYSANRDYKAFRTTHTPGGWFIQQDNSIGGFKDGVHEILENVNINGSGLALIPSNVGYGRTGTFTIPPNTVIMFEIRPVTKR